MTCQCCRCEVLGFSVDEITMTKGTVKVYVWFVWHIPMGEITVCCAAVAGHSLILAPRKITCSSAKFRPVNSSIANYALSFFLLTDAGSHSIGYNFATLVVNLWGSLKRQIFQLNCSCIWGLEFITPTHHWWNCAPSSYVEWCLHGQGCVRFYPPANTRWQKNIIGTTWLSCLPDVKMIKYG